MTTLNFDRFDNLTEDHIERLQDEQRRSRTAASIDNLAARTRVRELAAGTDAIATIQSRFRGTLADLAYDRTTTDQAALAARWAVLADTYRDQLTDEEYTVLTEVWDTATYDEPVLETADTE